MGFWIGLRGKTVKKGESTIFDIDVIVPGSDREHWKVEDIFQATVAHRPPAAGVFFSLGYANNSRDWKNDWAGGTIDFPLFFPTVDYDPKTGVMTVVNISAPGSGIMVDTLLVAEPQ